MDIARLYNLFRAYFRKVIEDFFCRNLKRRAAENSLMALLLILNEAFNYRFKLTKIH